MHDPYAIRIAAGRSRSVHRRTPAALIDNFLGTCKRLWKQRSATPSEAYPDRPPTGYPGIRAEAPARLHPPIWWIVIEPLIKQGLRLPGPALAQGMCAFSLTTAPANTLGPYQRTPPFRRQHAAHDGGAASCATANTLEALASIATRQESSESQRTTVIFIDCYSAELSAAAAAALLRSGRRARGECLEHLAGQVQPIGGLPR